MGYAVYKDLNGFPRWAGYGVPAVCDCPDCTAEIDRGLAYRCDEHRWHKQPDDADDVEHVDNGCGLYFCEAHRYDVGKHALAQPKPDSREWILHQLIDPSWAKWRNEEPQEVRHQQGLLV